MDSKKQMRKREIKFRAWDKSHKMMFYPKDITHITFGHSDWDMIYTKTGTPGSWGKKYPDEMDLMQFTGLHDKNGNEIYEGDILRCDWTDRKKHSLEYVQIEEIKKKIQTHEVFYSIHAAGFFIAIDKELSEEKYKDEILLTAYRAKSFTEVIGNIYENPELLNYPRDEREDTQFI